MKKKSQNERKFGPAFSEPYPGVAEGKSLSQAAVMYELVQTAVGDMIEIFDEDLPKDEAIEKISVLCERVAIALLGKDEAYAPIPNWNEPGAIDKKLGPFLLGDWAVNADAQEVMVTIVSQMFGRFMDLMQFAATPGVRDEQWQGSWNDLKNEYTELLMGVPPQPDYEAEAKKQTKRK